MNILLINHYAGSKVHGMEYRPFYLAREWVKLGHKVTIIAASFSHLRNQSPNISGEISQEIIEGVRYKWLKTPTYQGNGVGRIINMLMFILLLFKNKTCLIKEFKPDMVIASSTYPLDIFPAYRIAKNSGVKLIFEVHDLWPLTPIELGGMSPYHPFIIVMQWAENFAYRVADRVVSMLPKADSYMLEHGMASNKFVYIPNGIAVEEWENHNTPLPEQHRVVLDEIKKNGRFILGYAGGFGLSNALDYLVDAAFLLMNQPITVVMVGQGPEKERLQKKIMEKGIRNVVFLPLVSKTAIPSLLASMDILYIGWNKQPLYRFGICPNKLLDYMMAAKPVIHAVAAGNDLVTESGCGISVPPENPVAIADVVVNFIRMEQEERARMGSLGKKHVLANFNYRTLANRFLEILENLPNKA